MPRHRAGVAEAEIDQLVAVDINNSIALGALEENDVLTNPNLHPLHRYATDHVLVRLGSECTRLRRALRSDGPLPFDQLVESCAIKVGAFHQRLP